MAEIRQQLIANSAAIATGHPYGTAAGFEVLRDGGNAIDAAVAAMIAMCVVVPGSVGLGGYGGSAVIYKAGSKKAGVFAVDFDSRAPLAFRDGLVTAEPESSYYGPKSVTVPAVVAGLERILAEFGTRTWRDVSQPAIRLAQEGIEFDSEHKRHADRCAPKFDRQSLLELFPGGDVPQIGSRWCQPNLARLLLQLADDGPRAFYEGPIAERTIGFLRERGGLLTEEDFRTYAPQIMEPVHATFRAHELYTPPPPSGGITSLGIVQTLDRFDVNETTPWTGPYFHVLAEATKLCWQERHQSLGDPDFVSIPTDVLLSDEVAAARAEQIRECRTPHSPLPNPHSDSPHTANVVAADADGNLISLTATQGWMYGSHLVVDGLGLVLNHGMSRFDYVPGHPNSPAPGKRMQHNMTPMIALRSPSPLRGGARGGAAPAFAYGLPGGPKIVSVTAQLVLDTIGFGATPADAIAAPRLHTDGGEPLLVSQHMSQNIVNELESLAHQVRREDDMGGPVNVLAIDRQQGIMDIASGEATGAVAGY